MNQGECVFYLREIHGHWKGSTVSSTKLEELAEARLIEVRPHVGACMQVRLTHTGEQRKREGRSHYKTSLPLSNERPTRSRRVRPQASATKPKPLV